MVAGCGLLVLYLGGGFSTELAAQGVDSGCILFREFYIEYAVQGVVYWSCSACVPYSLE